MTALYYADTDALCDPILYDRAFASVSDERRAKTERFRFESDRRLSLGAGVLLRHALSEAGVDPDLPIIYGERGKPYLCGCTVHFNLSHSGTKVICAVSDGEVGCDIEKVGRSSLNVARRFFTPEEYGRILGCGSDAEKDILFCRYWVMKESLMKLTGLGLALSPSDFFVDIDRSVTELSGKTYRYTEFDEIDGYRVAVCTECGGEVRLCEVGIGDIV